MPLRTNRQIKRLEFLLTLQQRDLAKMAKRVGIRFRKNERRLFATQGGSGGPKWPKLSPAYKKRKRKLRPGKKIMVFDGRLRESLTKRNSGGYREAGIWRKGLSLIIVGTKDPKAAWHGPPNSRKNKRLPVRNVIQHTPRQLLEYNGLDIWPIMRAKFERAARVIASGARRR